MRAPPRARRLRTPARPASREPLRHDRREIHVRLRRRIGRIAQHHRLACRKRVGRRRGSRHHHIEYHVARKVLSHVFSDADAGGIRRFIHGEHETVERELIVDLDHVLNTPQNLRCGLQGQRLALQRHDHVLASLEHLANDVAEPGWRIHEDDVTALARLFEELHEERRLGEQLVVHPLVDFMTHVAGEHDAHPGERRRQHDLAKGLRAVLVVGQAMHRVPPAQPDSIPDRPLRVGVHDQRLQPSAGECRGEVYRRGGLSDAALLADDREHLTHALLELPRGIGGAVARRELIECLLRVSHPSVRFGALWRIGEKRVQVSLCTAEVAALEQQVRESVVGARKLRVELEGPAIGTHGVVELTRLGEGDRHVLENARVVGLIPQRQAIRGQRRIEVTLTLERERLGEVVDALRPDMLGVPAEDTAPPGHGIRGDEDVRCGCRAPEWTRGGVRQTAPLPRKVTDGPPARQPRSRAVKRLRSLRFGSRHAGVVRHVGTGSPPPNRYRESLRMSPRRVTTDPARGILEVEWPLFGELSRALALKVARSYNPDIVVGIANAGVIPGAVIAAILDVDFYSMIVSRRFGADEPRDTPAILGAAPAAVARQHVLVVDETCDSGDTLRLAVAAIVNAGAADVRTAVGFRTGSYAPDFAALETESLIILPWDREVLVDGELVIRPEYAEALKDRDEDE